MNTEQKDIRTIIKEMYVEIGKSIDMLPKIWEMKVEDFNERLGEDLGYAPATVQGYTTKSMTTEVKYSELFPALRRVMLSSIRDKESDPKHSETLKLKYTTLATPVLCMIAMQYSIIEFLAPAPKLLTNENEMALTLGQFIYGLWPKNSDGLSKEEADYLRECLKYYSPKCVKAKKVMDIASRIETYYGENLKTFESGAEIISERAKEIFKLFMADDIKMEKRSTSP